MKRGKFIVIEGGDAVGKNTQTKLLVQFIQSGGRQAMSLSFPRYETTLGKAILRHLNGQTMVGEGQEMMEAPEDPLVFQCMMIADRYEAASSMRNALSLGMDVICDRYTPSAIVYGSGEGLDERWLWNVHSSLPKADLNILLHAPLEEIRRRRPEARDRYEADNERRQLSLHSYHKLWNSNKRSRKWRKVSSVPTVEEVHGKIVDLYMSLFPKGT